MFGPIANAIIGIASPIVIFVLMLLAARHRYRAGIAEGYMYALDPNEPLAKGAKKYIESTIKKIETCPRGSDKAGA